MSCRHCKHTQVVSAQIVGLLQVLPLSLASILTNDSRCLLCGKLVGVNAERVPVNTQGARVCSSGWLPHCTMLGDRQKCVGGTEIVRKSRTGTAESMCKNDNNQVSRLLSSQFRVNCACD